MATPKTGSISMNDMRTHITRGSGAISMAEVRTRYDSTGALSFNTLRGCEGFTVNPTRLYKPGNKFIGPANNDGWSSDFIYGHGSVNPDDGNNSIQITSSSWIYRMEQNNLAGSSNSYLNISSGTSNDSLIEVGYRAQDITRVVTANTSRSIVFANTVRCRYTYDWPTSGTVHCLIKF